MPESSPLPSCSILLLAGGQGRRMGGADKGLLEWQGRPLVAWVAAAARPLTDDLIISCNRNEARYAAYADRVVADAAPDFPGPLAGIRAGMAAMRHDLLLVLPCDSPRVDARLLTDLADLARAHPGQPVMVRRGEDWEPLYCALPAALRPALEAAWQAGERSPRHLWRQLGAIALPCDRDDPRLGNFNTPDTLTAPR